MSTTFVAEIFTNSDLIIHKKEKRVENYIECRRKSRYPYVNEEKKMEMTDQGISGEIDSQKMCGTCGKKNELRGMSPGKCDRQGCKGCLGHQ